MRETIIVILLFLFAICAAFEAGYIVRGCQKDDTREIAVKAKEKTAQLNGRMAAIEGPVKDQKSVGSKQKAGH